MSKANFTNIRTIHLHILSSFPHYHTPRSIPNHFSNMSAKNKKCKTWISLQGNIKHKSRDEIISLYSSKMSKSRKTKTEELFQTKGDLRDMTIKCNIRSWIGSWRGSCKNDWSSCNLNRDYIILYLLNFLILIIALSLCKRMCLFLGNIHWII